jgi:hypothetical protein
MDTIGSLIDKLTVVNIRIWMYEDIKRDANALDEKVAHATRVTNICNQQRNDLIQEIDEMIQNAIINKQLPKLYKQGQTKLYGKT